MHKRRDVLRWMAASAVLTLDTGCSPTSPSTPRATTDKDKESPMTNTDTQPTPQRSSARMPVVFVGHGSPMNVIEDNRWSRGFAELSRLIPTPTAIVAVSAHWFVNGTFVTGEARPKTIHDFGGFPQALYEIQYPAPGKPDLARRISSLLSNARAEMSEQWGLDHGSWSVLHWMFPQAQIPVLQLSIDRRLRMQGHYDIGRALAPLRDEGVLILGSGNVTHNLRDALQRMHSGRSDTPDWAQRFDDTVKQATLQHDHKALISLWPDTDDGRMAHPSPDHWLPMLYVQGASDRDDRVQFPLEGFDAGSLSMRNVILG